MVNNQSGINWKNPEVVKNAIRSIGVAQGLTDAEIAFAIAIAAKESGFNVNAHNTGTKKNPENSWGVFQINTNAHPDYKGKLDPVANITYGVKFAANKLRQAKGDAKKAARMYNGSGEMAEKYSQDFIANYYPKYSGGQVTGAAAPVPSTTDANSDLGDRMANLVQNNVDLATQGISNYASTPYDAKQALMLRALRQAEAERYMNKVVDETPLNPSVQQVTEANKPFETNVQNLKDVTNQGLNQIQGIVDANRYQDYINQLNQAYNEQLSRLQAANPYTQMSQVAPINLDDYEKAARMSNLGLRNQQVINSLRGEVATPPDFQAEQMRVAQARQAAEMARQTGLTPEQFIQGRTADYNSMALALARRNKEFAAILNAAQQGDVSAMSAVNSIINNAMSNMTTSAANQATAQHNLAQDQIARAKENRERYFDMLKYQGGLDPNMVNAGANIQQQNISTAGGMYNTGLNSGTNAAGNRSDYEGKMLSGTTGEIMKPPTPQQVVSTMGQVYGMSNDSNAIQNWKNAAVQVYSAAGVPDNYLIPFLNQDNQ